MIRMPRIKGSNAFNDTETVKTFTLRENGHVTDFAIVVPNFTNVITVTLTIEDEDGVVLYTKAAIAKNATTIQNSISVPIDTGYICRLTLSGAAGGTGGTIATKLWVDTR